MIRPREVMVRQLAVPNAIVRKGLPWIKPGDSVYQRDSDITYSFRGGDPKNDASWGENIGPPGPIGQTGIQGEEGNRGIRGVRGNPGQRGESGGVAVASPVVEVDPDEALAIVTTTTSESYAMRRPDEKYMRRGLKMLRYQSFPDWVYIGGTEDELDSGAVISLLLAAIRALTKRIEALEP